MFWRWTSNIHPAPLPLPTLLPSPQANRAFSAYYHQQEKWEPGNFWRDKPGTRAGEMTSCS